AHAAGMAVAAAQGQSVAPYFMNFVQIVTQNQQPAGGPLAVTYACWAIGIVLLYFPCRWFAEVKARRRDWWRSSVSAAPGERLARPEDASFGDARRLRLLLQVLVVGRRLRGLRLELGAGADRAGMPQLAGLEVRAALLQRRVERLGARLRRLQLLPELLGRGGPALRLGRVVGGVTGARRSRRGGGRRGRCGSVTVRRGGRLGGRGGGRFFRRRRRRDRGRRGRCCFSGGRHGGRGRCGGDRARAGRRRGR